MPIYLSFKENFKFGGIESAEEGSKRKPESPLIIILSILILDFCNIL